MDAAGNVYVPDGARIRKISTDGTVTTIAGTGVNGYSGDDGPASAAQVSYSVYGQGLGLATDAAGNLYVADTGNSRVQKSPRIRPSRQRRATAADVAFRLRPSRQCRRSSTVPSELLLTPAATSLSRTRTTTTSGRSRVTAPSIGSRALVCRLSQGAFRAECRRPRRLQPARGDGHRPERQSVLRRLRHASRADDFE